MTTLLYLNTFVLVVFVIGNLYALQGLYREMRQLQSELSRMTEELSLLKGQMKVNIHLVDETHRESVTARQTLEEELHRGLEIPE